MAKKGMWKEFTKGIVKENPVLRLVLGTCATLALSTSASNAIGMGCLLYTSHQLRHGNLHTANRIRG